MTDQGKRSNSGRFKLLRDESGGQATYRTVSATEPGEDLLQTVFENGVVVRRTTFAEVRQRAAAGL